MGRYGPVPQPTAMRRMKKSNPSGTSRPAKNEPQPPAGIPEYPEWADLATKWVWDIITPQLSAMGVMTKADAGIAARYGDLQADYKAQCEMINKMGRMIPRKDKNGNVIGVMNNPLVSARAETMRELRHIEDRLGLNPAARTRIESSVTNVVTVKTEGDENDEKLIELFKTG